MLSNSCLIEASFDGNWFEGWRDLILGKRSNWNSERSYLGSERPDLATARPYLGWKILVWGLNILICVVLSG